MSDYLDEEVDEKYFISPTNFLYYTDLKDRNGFVRGQRFKPHSRDAKYAYTLTTGSGNSPTDNFILVPEATKVGMRKANVGDGIYINRPHQKRGVVQIESIPTLKTSAVDIGVLVESEKNLVAIRRLTPKECFRLMGWSSYDFTRVEGKISETALYKLAGNSVVVPLLKEIFRQLFKDMIHE